MVIDIGTGDGRRVLAVARQNPATLAIGLDASTDGMIQASRRAARPARRGGLDNALFVVAAAEALPHELGGTADAITIHFPWGSLLRGAVCADEWLAGALSRLLRPAGTLELLLSVTSRDAATGLPPLDAAEVACIAGRWQAAGFVIRESRAATPGDLRAAHSTWARRLASGNGREAWLIRLARGASGGVR